MLRESPRRERLQVEFGRNIRRWRRVNQMSATDLAERASVTRATLRGIEAGTGTARIDSLFAVLIALGVADTVVEATDPYTSVTGRARIDELLRRGGKL